MENLDFFNVVAGSASIISLVIACLAWNKASKVETKINESVGNVNQKAKGKNISQAGRDILNKKS